MRAFAIAAILVAAARCAFADAAVPAGDWRASCAERLRAVEPAGTVHVSDRGVAFEWIERAGFDEYYAYVGFDVRHRPRPPRWQVSADTNYVHPGVALSDAIRYRGDRYALVRVTGHPADAPLALALRRALDACLAR